MAAQKQRSISRTIVVNFLEVVLLMAGPKASNCPAQPTAPRIIIVKSHPRSNKCGNTASLKIMYDPRSVCYAKESGCHPSSTKEAMIATGARNWHVCLPLSFFVGLNVRLIFHYCSDSDSDEEPGVMNNT